MVKSWNQVSLAPLSRRPQLPTPPTRGQQEAPDAPSTLQSSQPVHPGHKGKLRLNEDSPSSGLHLGL